ncbi:1-phosphofructokinase family hexose kinase [Rhizobium cremeum]|uniref:1-phosphofructokinase family hexose kinase n=1 Tax=Rhizobium cremeum TaxID=2813827 RepID=UPI000DDD61F3|nr:1-phosphofructokinase family hexose kinase [Rhizobium cremeum]MCJ7996521.1 1-phosphofructokinase family hexose kinase [Rhizobium cremeum]MCJ8001780.1 1-phosphofructokinase family hexose kinase [Rhizobium cremeum]
MSKILSIALNPAIDISSDADEVRHTHKTRTHNQRQHAGGGGINVARVIVELGGHCELLYLSGGATGELLETMLRPLGIRQHVMKIHDPVRVAYNVHELSTNLEYRFVPEGPLVSDAELASVFDILEKCDADYVVASGSLPRGVPADTYLRMAEIAARRNQRFVLDTSGEALRETLASCHVFLVKPSLGELEGLVGRKLDHESVGPAAQEVIRRGAAQYIAVTLGADGAVLVGADSITRVPAIKVAVQSAVGAGDSFVAGMTWSLAEGKDIVEAFRLGMAAGAAAVMTSGTELCRRRDILDLYVANRG